MEETTLDLRDVIKTLKKRRKLIINTFLFFVITAIVVSFLIPPTYEAETALRIKQPKGLADSLLGDLPTGNPMGTKQLMSTYAEILKSRTVIQEVIDKTQTDKEELPTYEDFLKRITTQPVKDTEILDVKVQAKSQEEAQTVANTLVQVFLDRLTSLVRSEQSRVREFIGSRMKESKQELEQAENLLQKYKYEQKIVSPSEESKAMVEKLADIDKLAAENKVALASAQAKKGSTSQQIGQQKPGFIADSLLIQQYKGKLADLEVQLVSESQNYTDKHPKVIALQAAIAETNAKLNEEITRVVNAEAPSMNPIHQGLLQTELQAEAEIAVAAARKQAIDKIMAEREQQIVKLPAKEQGLVKVMRDANVAQEIYIMLAKRYEEARISEVMEPTDVQIIDEAIFPDEPIKPKKLLNTVIAAILGIFVGVGLAFLSEYMNKTIRTTDDVKQYLDLPVLGSIPDFDSDVRQPSASWVTRFSNLIGSKRRHQG
ncbi:Tyrosine-protein kinase etk [Sporomusa ovata DSM 2662]|uniref:Tyrosine-protein kinase transmembrane modulator EpsC n=1 Tax=Sporomusa ovata TaxID=2378 RepID=A0A0U1KT00_9FIRM|nr:GumC family protein [Sporomusa ovata]EQB26461.1 lipopolysaccharide biosynthesis protein [Sporomusa ovata DSM 2662]CQR70546.1 Tyrosine-protein kinase transmembrane modulator EpsC [Sporomusa ovata]